MKTFAAVGVALCAAMAVSKAPTGLSPAVLATLTTTEGNPGLSTRPMPRSVAVIVGISSYPFLKQTQPFMAAENDLAKIRKLLDSKGFEIIQLKDSEATEKAIRAALAQATKDPQVISAVFYFTGCGSVAPSLDTPSDKSKMEPTIVPYDGSASSHAKDIRMATLEKWSAKLQKAGASTTIMVDACFKPVLERAFEFRRYNHVPRYVVRASSSGGKVRTRIYEGPGVFLCACGPTGAAYEWKEIGGADNPWVSAFTSVLYAQARYALLKQKAMSSEELLRSAQAFFLPLNSQSYMPGETPYPSAGDLTGSLARAYAADFLGSSTPAQGTDEHAALKTEVATRIDRSRALRVVVGAEILGTKPAERQALIDQVTKALKAQIDSGKLWNVTVIEPDQDLPDIALYVGKDEGGISIRVLGDEHDHAYHGGDDWKFVASSAGDAADLLTTGFLQKQACAQRLWRMHDFDQGTGAQGRLEFSKDRLTDSERYELTVAPGAPGYALILDQDESDGRVQLIGTLPVDGALKLNPGIEPGSAIGRAKMRAVFVEGKEGLPEFVPDGGHDEDSADPATRVKEKKRLEFLMTLVKAIEAKQIKWSSTEHRYEIVGS